MNSKIDFVNGGTRKNLFCMVMPLLMAMFLTMAYNLVDSLWVGNLLGGNGYAALTESTAVILILNAIGMGAGNGVSILISQIVGAREKDKAEQVISVIMVLSAAFSIILTIVTEAGLKRILVGMGTPLEILDDTYSYLSVYLLGYFFIYLYMQFTAVFRAFGDPMFQMKGMLLSTLLNACIDPMFIQGMGLRGAAWATVLSEVLCYGYALFYYRKRRIFRIQPGSAFAHREYIRPVLKDAIPSAVQQCMPAVSSAVMTILVSRFGVQMIAAYGVATKLEIFLFYPAMAVNMALVTIVGQCIGAKRIDRAKEYLRCACIYGGAAIGIVTVTVFAFSGQLSGLFVPDGSAAEMVKTFFEIVSVGYVMYMLTSCFLGFMSGAGKPGLSMLLFFIYYIVIRIPLAILLIHTGLGITGIWLAILISHIAAALIAWIAVMQRR